jgi:hypothetical protein
MNVALIGILGTVLYFLGFMAGITMACIIKRMEQNEKDIAHFKAKKN